MIQLTIEQIRQNHLRKQYFTERQKITFFDIAKAHLGLHSTDYWSPYLSIWARIGTFEPRVFYKAINSGNTLARIHAFRGAVHLVHRDNLPLIVAATGPRLYRMVRRGTVLSKYSDQQLEVMLRQFYSALDEKPLRMRELKQALPELAPKLRSLLYIGMATGQVVRATTPHARSPLSTYALTKNWLPGLNMEQYSEETAFFELIQRYIAVFGPVSIEDIAWWLPTTKTQATRVVNELGTDIVPVKIAGESKYMLANDLEMAQTQKSSSVPTVFFLPYEDYFPKGYLARSWYISPEFQLRLFPRTSESYWPLGNNAKRMIPVTSAINQSGEIRPSIWLDGQIIGRWEFGEADGRYTIGYDVYPRLSQKLKQMIKNQHSELETFVNEKLVPISTS